MVEGFIRDSIGVEELKDGELKKNIKEIKKMHTIKTHECPSPCGDLILGSFGDELCLCDWWNEKRRATIDRRRTPLMPCMNRVFPE